MKITCAVTFFIHLLNIFFFALLIFFPQMWEKNVDLRACWVLVGKLTANHDLASFHVDTPHRLNNYRNHNAQSNVDDDLGINIVWVVPWCLFLDGSACTVYIIIDQKGEAHITSNNCR